MNINTASVSRTLSTAGKKTAKVVPQVLLYAVMTGLAFIFLYPFLFMLVTSLMNNSDLNNSLVRWLPRELYFENFSMAARLMDYWATTKNTVFYTVAATVGQLISCSMAGYALARFEFFGRKIAMFFIILAMLVPTQTIIVPQYVIYTDLEWLNTFNPLVIPSFLGFGLRGPLFIYIFRQFFLGQPRELEEAARVDGCGFIRTFTHVVFPVAKSIYIVVLVLALVWHWADFFEPSMYLNKSHLKLVSMRLQGISDILTLPADVLQSEHNINDNNPISDATLMAGTFMVVLPILIAYGFLQKQFVQGIERSGLTGE